MPVGGADEKKSKKGKPTKGKAMTMVAAIEKEDEPAGTQKGGKAKAKVKVTASTGSASKKAASKKAASKEATIVPDPPSSPLPDLDTSPVNPAADGKKRGSKRKLDGELVSNCIISDLLMIYPTVSIESGTQSDDVNPFDNQGSPQSLTADVRNLDDADSSPENGAESKLDESTPMEVDHDIHDTPGIKRPTKKKKKQDAVEILKNQVQLLKGQLAVDMPRTGSSVGEGML